MLKKLFSMTEMIILNPLLAQGNKLEDQLLLSLFSYIIHFFSIQFQVDFRIIFVHSLSL